MSNTALLISDIEDKLFSFKHQLTGLGYEVAWCPLAVSTALLRAAVVNHKPAAVVVVCAKVNEEVLVQLRHIMAHTSEPVLVFTDDDDSAMVEEVLKAGVSAYIVDAAGVNRLPAILRVAIARSRLEQARRLSLLEAQRALQERKTIDRAKGILMDRKRLSEDQAYQLLRKTAMNNNEKMIDVAQRVVSAVAQLA